MADHTQEEPMEHDIHVVEDVVPEQVTRKRKKWSKVWNSFLVVDRKETIDGKERALCIHCKSTSVIADSHYGTKNLHDHLGTCKPYLASLVGNGGSSNFSILDQKVYRELIAIAIIMHSYAFSWVEHEGNGKIHAYLNSQVQTITRNTAKADCLKMHNNLKTELMDTLQKLPGRISFTSDMWTSCQTEGYLCLTAHYVDLDWKLKSRVLSFCRVESPHTGHAMYTIVSKLFREWGIEHKIVSITLDNASSNDKMQYHLKCSLEEHGLLFHGGYLHVRCAAHVLNLIVKDGLGLITDSVEKIRQSVKYVKWSEGRKKDFKECVIHAKINETKTLWLDVPTRWNSTYLMLDRALLYRAAFKELDGRDHLYKHFPELDEWDKVEKIRDVLEPFSDITELFSGTDYPTANLYFENVWKIEMLLKDLWENTDKTIKAMVKAMKEKFDKYWCISIDDGDYKILFAIAAMLDPRYKKQFLIYCYEGLFGDERKARQVVNDLVTKLENLLDEYLVGESHSYQPAPYVRTVRSRTSGSRKQKVDPLAGFDDRVASQISNTSMKSQLKTYLDDPLIDQNTQLDILHFWQTNESKYGELSHLARDVLSVPLTTVASESTFSIGGRVLNKWRSSYLLEYIEALITSRSCLCGYTATEEEEFLGSEVNWNSI